MSRRSAIVGNAPLPHCLAEKIDAADHVIRFNKAPEFAGWAGTRTDELYLINHGGQMAEWLEQDTLLDHPPVRAARRIVLPIPLLPGHLPGPPHGRPHGAEAVPSRADDATDIDPDRINHLHRARQVLEAAGHRVESVDEAAYRSVQRTLLEQVGEQGWQVDPSTGFIAILRTVARSEPGERVDLYGFTFQGWSGHRWNAEHACVERLARAGRLHVHGATAHETPQRAGRNNG